MTISYHPYTEEELNQKREESMKILDPGIYDFEVVTAEETQSKSGNPMVVLDLTVWDSTGGKHSIRDYLVIMDSMLFKMKHFWESVGRHDMYGKDAEAFDFMSLSGKLETTIQEQMVDKKDGSGKEKRRFARVKDYIPVEKVAPKAADPFDDDVPF